MRSILCANELRGPLYRPGPHIAGSTPETGAGPGFPRKVAPLGPPERRRILIRDLERHARKPEFGICFLVTGETGSGKTHFIEEAIGAQIRKLRDGELTNAPLVLTIPRPGSGIGSEKKPRRILRAIIEMPFCLI